MIDAALTVVDAGLRWVGCVVALVIFVVALAWVDGWVQRVKRERDR